MLPTYSFRQLHVGISLMNTFTLFRELLYLTKLQMKTPPKNRHRRDSNPPFGLAVPPADAFCGDCEVGHLCPTRLHTAGAADTVTFTETPGRAPNQLRAERERGEVIGVGRRSAALWKYGDRGQVNYFHVTPMGKKGVSHQFNSITSITDYGLRNTSPKTPNRTMLFCVNGEGLCPRWNISHLRRGSPSLLHRP